MISHSSKMEKKKAFSSVIQTRKTAGWLAGELSRESHQVALLSGEMQVEQRAAVIERFRDGKEKVLVTTNVCARGKNSVPGHLKRTRAACLAFSPS